MEETWSLILGIIQGATEILPVSSSGHLIIADYFLSRIGVSGTLTLGMVIALHLGTTLSLLIVMRREVLEVLRSLVWWLRLARPHQNPVLKPTERSARLAQLLATSSISTAALLMIPVILMWLLSYDAAQDPLEVPEVAGTMLMVNGILLMVVRRLSDGGQRSILEIDVKDAIVIGLAQALGIIPGISRMGITLLTACWRRMTWQASLTYSFLLSIPIVLLGAFEELLRLNPSELTHNGAWQQLTAGALVAGAAGLVAASFLRGRLGRKSLLWLTGWCLMLGGTTVTVLIAASLN